MKSTGGPKYPIWRHFLTSALPKCNERKMAIIVTTFCLEEFLQAGSEHKASDLRVPVCNNCKLKPEQT